MVVDPFTTAAFSKAGQAASVPVFGKKITTVKSWTTKGGKDMVETKEESYQIRAWEIGLAAIAALGGYWIMTKDDDGGWWKMFVPVTWLGETDRLPEPKPKAGAAGKLNLLKPLL